MAMTDKLTADHHARGSLQATTLWYGQPTTLAQNASVVMPQTPNGSLVFSYQNQSNQNNQGQLALTSGGGSPQILQAVALQPMPQILVANYRADNLSVTNVSAQATPIWIEAAGPGMVGQSPLALPTTGTPILLAPAQSAQGVAPPQWMQLLFSASAAQPTTIAVVGGPPDASGNNAYVFGLNATGNGGPGTGAPPPQGYYATTTGNSYAFQFNWGSSTVYVANMSVSSAATAQVRLIAL
jgi:hypothetical protein